MTKRATDGRRITPSQKAIIKRLAERRGTTQKVVILEVVERDGRRRG